MAVLTSTQRDTKLARLGRQPLLKGCRPAELVRIARIFDEIEVPAGTRVVEAAPLARWFFLIEEGEADVITLSGDRTTVGPGGFCGTEALHLRRPQTATVRARTDVRAFVASARDILGAVSDIPALAAGPLGALAAAAPAPPRPKPRVSAAPIAIRATPRVAHTVARAPAPPVRTGRSLLPWAIAGAVVVALLALAARYHPPVVMLTPGTAVDISNDVTITGAPTYPLNGRYLMTPVRLSRPSLLALGLAKLTGDGDIVALRQGVDRDALHRAGRAAFDDSRMTAAAAAAHGAGLQVTAQFRRRDIVGPSAGLAYALLVRDLLGPEDLARGRDVAATGTVDAAGRVGPVGSVAEKIVGARHGGAALMLLPVDQLGAGTHSRLTLIGVTSLIDASEALSR